MGCQGPGDCCTSRQQQLPAAEYLLGRLCMAFLTVTVVHVASTTYQKQACLLEPTLGGGSFAATAATPYNVQLLNYIACTRLLSYRSPVFQPTTTSDMGLAAVHCTC